MSQFRICMALAFVVVAGCATAGHMAADGSAQTRAQGVPVVTAADAPDVLQVDADDFNPGSTVVCREMLKTGSNVIQTYCMTRDDWKRFARRQEREAQEMLRVMQGGAYR